MNDGYENDEMAEKDLFDIKGIVTGVSVIIIAGILGYLGQQLLKVQLTLVNGLIFFLVAYFFTSWSLVKNTIEKIAFLKISLILRILGACFWLCFGLIILDPTDLRLSQDRYISYLLGGGIICLGVIHLFNKSSDIWSGMNRAIYGKNYEADQKWETAITNAIEKEDLEYKKKILTIALKEIERKYAENNLTKEVYTAVLKLKKEDEQLTGDEFKDKWIKDKNTSFK